jgi:hypothetical protein
MYKSFEGRCLAALQSFNELAISSFTRFLRGRRGNLFQFDLPAEGYWLSVAH